MKGLMILMLGGLSLWPLSAQAHCDAVDGPVATADATLKQLIGMAA